MITAHSQRVRKNNSRIEAPYQSFLLFSPEAYLISTVSVMNLNILSSDPESGGNCSADSRKFDETTAMYKAGRSR
jgi:hypothetical protein